MNKARFPSLKATVEAIRDGNVPNGHAHVWLDKEIISVYAREGGLHGQGESQLLYETDEATFMVEALGLLGIEADHV